jgi:hypothetical protein
VAHIEETSTSSEEEGFTSQTKTVVTPFPTLALAPNLTIEDSIHSIHLTAATSQLDVNIQFVTTSSPLQHLTTPVESFEQARSDDSLTHVPYTDHSSEDALLSTTSPLLPIQKTTQSSESTANPVDGSTSKDNWTIEPLKEASSSSTESESSTSTPFYEKDPDYGIPVDYEAPDLSKVESVPIYPGAPPSALPQTTQSQSVISAGSESVSEGSTSQSSVIAGSTSVVPAVDLESDKVEDKTELSAAITSPPSMIITKAPTAVSLCIGSLGL